MGCCRKSWPTKPVSQAASHDALEIEGFLTAVRESGLVAQDVEIRKADLEDVFLDVMKKNSGQAKPSASIAQTQEALV
jgi:ABC-2 type transport system ATP-binding protein